MFGLFVCAEVETDTGIHVIRKTFAGKSGRIAYCQIEENMKRPGETAALVLILHGKSGAGRDNSRQLSSPAVESLLKFTRSGGVSVLILVPQCPPERDWVRGGENSVLTAVAELTAEKCREFRIPPERCYVTGVSMGGGACYAIMAARPGRFAKAVVVSAGGRPELAGRLTGDFYIVHGGNDRLIPVQRARRMAQAIGCRGGGHVQFVCLPGKGHTDGAEAAYSRTCWEWLFC